jgi:hypothetical protein
MFNILRHKGNENPKSTETPSHPSQNGNHEENKQMLMRMQGERNPYTPLMDM